MIKLENATWGNVQADIIADVKTLTQNMPFVHVSIQRPPAQAPQETHEIVINNTFTKSTIDLGIRVYSSTLTVFSASSYEAHQEVMIELETLLTNFLSKRFARVAPEEIVGLDTRVGELGQISEIEVLFTRNVKNIS